LGASVDPTEARKASFSRMAITTCGRESISTAIAWLPCCGPTPGNVN
jgi:hypothetical protein